MIAVGSISSDQTYEQWLDELRHFAEVAIAPRVAEMDRAAELDPKLRHELFEHGLMSLTVPSTYGGWGMSFFQVSQVIEQVARVCSGVALVVDVHNVLVSSVVDRHGSGDQRRRFLPALAKTTLGAFAISEDRAGSDAFALETEAASDGRDYRLTGRKCWTSSAGTADLFLVFARMRESCGGGLSAFLLNRDSPGLTVEANTDQVGVRAAATGDLVLDDVRVPRSNILGKAGHGGAIALEAFAFGRVGIAAQLVGLSQGALDAAVHYAGERQQFGRYIAAFQGVRFPLAATAAEIEAARTLTHRAAQVIDDHVPRRQQLIVSTMAKYVASVTASRAAARAVATCGSRGVVRGSNVEKMSRDALTGTIYEGTSNLLLRTISSSLFPVAEGEYDD